MDSERQRLVAGVDGGNSKTELLVARLGGEPVAYVRGPGSNSHGVGAEGCAAIVASLFERAALPERPVRGAFFLCGADVESYVADLRDAIERRALVGEAEVDNDTFALLRAGASAQDAVAVVCGAGINCVGRRADGRVARYPALGWETGEWGGSEMLGREVLFLAARAEDGRGEPTRLAELVRRHFGAGTVAEVGASVHYRRVRPERLGELAPEVVALAEAGDAVARRLVERLADEVALLAWRALRDLELLARPVEVVLGGGMLGPESERLVGEVAGRLARRAPHARIAVTRAEPVVGAALAALDAAGAGAEAGERLRDEFPRLEAVDVAAR